MKNQPLVSIILPTYNREGYTKRAIRSALSQTYKNIELIIIDDDSTDETPKIISELSRKDSRIIILRNETNLGFVKSLNIGIRRSQGKYIARLDDDDIWLDQKKLEKQVEFLEKNPDYVLVGGGMIKIDEKDKEIARYLFPEKDNDIRKSILIDNPFTHSTVVFRKDVFEQTGGYKYEEEFGFFADRALWLKLGKFGKFYNFPDYFTYYLEPQDKRSDCKIRRRLKANIKLRKKYRRDYPGFYKSLLVCLSRYFYSFLPFRKALRPLFLKLRNIIFGPPAYKSFKTNNIILFPSVRAPKEEKTKVCQVASVDLTVRFLLLRQIQFLKKQGFKVSSVCSKGKWTQEIEAHGIKVKTVKIKRKISPISDLITLFNLIFYFEEENFDIVHTHTPKASLLGQVAAKIAGVPIIINTIHGYYFTENTGFLKRKFFILIEKIAALFSDLIFFQSKEDMETCVKEKIFNLKKIRFLGNGINLKRFNPQRFSSEFIDKKKNNLGINPAVKIIGMVGRLVKEKGYLELFEAFQKVLEKFPQILLLIVGQLDTEKRDSLKPEIVKKYKIGDKIKFLGLREDIEEIYPLMDIFVLPSWREGFPRSVLEASAMGKPVIATDIRGCREAVEDGKTGLLVPVKNPERLAKAITQLLENPEMAREMGGAGAKKAQKEFDENQIFDRINKEYEYLPSQKR